MNRKIGIGIDTGGTYTDAVIYKFNEKKILGVSKALTTKENLSVGILEALDKLPQDLTQKAEIVSLSTTLATNACVEDKSGRAKLILFGGDRRIIEKSGHKYGLPTVEEIYIQDSFTKFSGESDRDPDWEAFINNIENGFENIDGVGIVEVNAMRDNAAVEKKAKKLFQMKYNVPVVCGHELFTELNYMQRGASTLLNASLFPVIEEFLNAIKTAMLERNIKARVVIVRSDGGLMSEKFASVRPVETLLCGPAASVIGGKALSHETNSIVIDMGGTTTDIALIKNNVPVKVVNGVQIGKWKTFVKGVYIKTFGLGGDSAVHYNDKNIYIENYRVVPICVAAHKHPDIIGSLKELTENFQKHTKFLYEHFILVKDISDSTRYTEYEKSFCKALKNGPLDIRRAAEAVGTDIYNLNVSRLLKNGVIQLCGFTPTDVMHIRNDFSKYSSEASLLCAQYIAYNLDISVEELCGIVYDEVKRKIYVNVVKAMLENKNKYYMDRGFSEEVNSFINESYALSKRGIKDEFISMQFSTDFTLIGVGAPIKFFLEDVAALLGTKAVIPENFEVANAVGAVVGNVSASYSVEIKPHEEDGIEGYIVYGYSANRVYETLDEAKAFAASEAKKVARNEAVNRGARGRIALTCEFSDNVAEGRDCTVYLGTTVTADAVGNLE